MASAKKPASFNKAAKKPARKAAASKAASGKAASKKKAQVRPEAPETTAQPEAPTSTPAPGTLGQSFGEMVWLLSQSPLHKGLTLADLEWLIMPAIVLNQVRVFKVGQEGKSQAVGLALWAYLTPDEAAAMNKAGRLTPEGWRHGTDIRDVLAAEKEGNPLSLTPPELVEGELELWLVDLVVPHATPENKLAEACLSDLLTGPLKGKKLKMQRVDQKTGDKSIIELGGE